VSKTPEDLPKGTRMEWAGTILVILGVAVWGVYAVLRWGFGHNPAGYHFVVFHLMGVIPGSILRHWRRIRRLFR
jgi:hypothetical protein